MRALFLLLLCGAWLAPAQSLRIYSEFRRIDPFGEVAAPDRGGEPREILSPAVLRNGWNSFHIACTVPEGASFLYIQQNPELFEVKLYREIFAGTAKGWVPDRLEPVTPPYMIELPDKVNPVPKQTTVVFWLDIRVPADTPPGRMRMQAVMKSGELWLVSPMEIRIQPAVARKEQSGAGALPPVTARADAALLGMLERRLCGTRDSGNPGTALTVRSLLRRNALQDLTLARYDLSTVLEEAGYPLASFCGLSKKSLPGEWWLGVRQRLYRKPAVN